jgi:hypothetical protein
MNWAVLKKIVKQTPGVREIALEIQRSLARRRSLVFNSSEYWNQRYMNQGTSGTGSYNRLARFKAETLNAFVTDHGIMSVIEFGSGDGNQLRLARYPKYVGIDVSHAALGITRTMFADDPSKRFLHISEVSAADTAELALSLDVIYHLVEDSVFEAYMSRLFDAAKTYTVIYSSNMIRWDAPHVRHRRFTDWIDENRSDFRLIDTLRNPYPEDPRDLDNTSCADFFFYEKMA